MKLKLHLRLTHLSMCSDCMLYGWNILWNWICIVLCVFYKIDHRQMRTVLGKSIVDLCVCHNDYAIENFESGPKIVNCVEIFSFFGDRWLNGMIWYNNRRNMLVAFGNGFVSINIKGLYPYCSGILLSVMFCKTSNFVFGYNVFEYNCNTVI